MEYVVNLMDVTVKPSEWARQREDEGCECHLGEICEYLAHEVRGRGEPGARFALKDGVLGAEYTQRRRRGGETNHEIS